MSMNAAILATAIVASKVANSDALGLTTPGHPTLTTPQLALIQKEADIMAASIVNHIASLGVIAIASVSGVTTGSGVSGPGVGTIS